MSQLLSLLCWLVALAIGVLSVLRVRERKLELKSHKLDKAYRLVQLSDVHVGSRSAQFLNNLIAQTLRHEPDVVVITGDLLDLDHVDESLLTGLKTVNCPVFLCIGNHERYVDLAKAIRAIETNGVRVLRNESVSHGKLQIIGIDDQNEADDVLPVLSGITISPGHYQVLLYHRPDGWHAAIEHGVDLTLSGHTHAGQIWPFGHIVKLRFPQMAGYFQHDTKHLYVSPGSGTWGPTMRLGTRSELTIVDLLPG